MGYLTVDAYSTTTLVRVMSAEAPKPYDQAILFGWSCIMPQEYFLRYLVFNFWGLLDVFREFCVEHLSLFSVCGDPESAKETHCAIRVIQEVFRIVRLLRELLRDDLGYSRNIRVVVRLEHLDLPKAAL